MYRVTCQCLRFMLGRAVFLTVFVSCSLFLPPAASLTLQSHAHQSLDNRPAPLTQGRTSQHELKGTETYTEVISLRRGEFLRVVVEQKGINVTVTLRSPEGAELVKVNLLAQLGPEPVSFESPESGDYVLEIRPVEGTAPAGRFSVTRLVTTRATTEDKLRLKAERVLVGADELFQMANSPEQLRAAATTSKQGLILWRALKDDYWAGYSLNKLGLIYRELGDWQKALDFYAEALRLRRSVGDRRGEAATLENFAYLYDSTNRKQQAIDTFKKALQIQRAIGDPLEEGNTLNAIGNVYASLGDRQLAINFHKQALALYKTIRNVFGEAFALKHLATSYAALDDRQTALAYFNEAIAIFRAHDDRISEADTLISIGDMYRISNNREKAIEYYHQALTIGRAAGDRNEEAAALAKIGEVTYLLGNRQKALAYFNQVIELWRTIGNNVGEADGLSSLGFIYNNLGEWQKAIEYYKQALKLYKAAGAGRGQANALKSIGDIFNERDEQKKALGFYIELLRIQQAAGDRYAEATTLTDIGFTYDDLGESKATLDYLNRALAVYRAQSDRIGEADALTNIGTIYYRLDNMPKALEYYEQALPLYKAQNHRVGEATTLNYIGLVHNLRNDRQSALKYYERALLLAREIPDQRAEAKTLVNMGLIYSDLDDQQKALDYYAQSLQRRREIGDTVGEADILINIGVSYSSIKDHQKALAQFEQALKIRRADGDRSGEANALTKIGGAYLALGEKGDALKYHKEALLLFRTLADSGGERDALVNIGYLSLTLGQYNQARIHLNQALSLVRKAEDRELEAAVLFLAGAASYGVDDKRKAIEQLEQSLSIFSATKSDLGQGGALFFLGVMYQDLGDLKKALSYFDQALVLMMRTGQGEPQANISEKLGEIYASLGNNNEALDAYSRSLALYRAAGNLSGEASALTGIGRVYDARGENQKAAGYYAQALLRTLETKKESRSPGPVETSGGTYDALRERRESLKFYFQNYQMAHAQELRGIEAETLGRIMVTLKKQTPELAIVFGKKAIEMYQQIRSNPGQYDLELAENTYLRSYKTTYRDLADILIENGRLFEAQQILSMLKEEEYFEYVRRDAGEIAALSRRMDLRPEEQKLFAEYSQIFDRITTIGSKQAELSAKKKALREGARLSDAEESDLERLTDDLTLANDAFDSFLKRIKSEFSNSRRDISAEIRQNRGLQRDLKLWGAGTVSLYTYVGPDRYRVILTTPNTQVDAKTDITAKDLNKKIMAFRQTIMNPAIDPRPQASELYDVLVKPIEKQLEGAGAKTLVWVLDGSLRYLPFSALYDGEHYMVERYQQVVITLASRTRLSEQVKNEWRGLGLGVSAKWGTLDALPAVVGELQSIIRDEKATGTQPGIDVGLIPGRSLLDKDFTARAFADALGRNYSVVHIASHFIFSPGDEDKSFLLLGDGNRLTLKTIRTAGDYDFNGVELLTLSACNTGMGANGDTPEADGNEVEGLGVLAQNRGAKAIIATLWAVADESTRTLMREFYRIHSTTPNISKAEALRRAQLSLLNGDVTASSVSGSGVRNVRADLAASQPPAPRFSNSAGKPYAHPYYWAPFILLGNWR